MQLSILIRNLNEAESLEQALLALQKQQTSFDYEIVVIDNESEDNSRDIALSRAAGYLLYPEKNSPTVMP